MYQILIVDDEILIAQGLKFLIEKGLPECKVIAVAGDGTEGYETAIATKPDIILTDVRMYEISGIEMIRSLKNAGLETHYIILSGYADFEYARQAVSLGVEDYITKPVEEEELYGIITKVCKCIQKERLAKDRVEELQKAVGEYSKSMKEYQLWDMVQGRHQGEKPLQEDEFWMKSFFLCAVFECTGVEKQEDAIKTFLIEQLQEQTDKGTSIELLNGAENNQWIIILGAAGDSHAKEIKKCFRKVRISLQDYARGYVCGGIGLWHRETEGIEQSYEEALCSLNYKVVKGPESLVCYDEIRDISANATQIEEVDIQELERCIIEMDNDGCRKVIDKIFRSLDRNENLSPENVQFLAINLILSGIQKMPFMQLQINEYLGKNIFTLQSIEKFKTMEQLKNWIINVVQGMNELMVKQNLPDKRDVVKEVQEYIHANFNKEISLMDISEKFYINPYYFSKLFKKKTGETYQNYLTKVRITRAKKLLEETDLKLYEICEMIGYLDVNYFSQVFEKKEGIKPSNYRKHLRQ